MPDIGQLTRRKPTPVVIDLGDGDIVNIEFDRNRITPVWIREAERRDTERDTLSLPKALADVILSWDVTQDEEPFPPTAENLAVFSYPAQRALLEKMLAAAIPGEAEGNASSGTSSTPSIASSETPASSPNGQATSASPAPSASLSPT